MTNANEDAPTEQTLSFVVEEDDIQNLAVLAPTWVDFPEDDLETRARDVLERFCERVAVGITGPNSWERRWLQQAFGDEWIARLEADPDYPYRQRPKAPTPPTGEEPGGAA